MQSEVREIEGPADFELGVPRARPLRYIVSTPDKERPKGLVFAIPGFGADSAAGYAEALRRHICDTHGLAAVSVDYHCIQARRENGGAVSVPLREHLMLLGLAALNGVKINNTADLNELTTKLAKLNLTIDAYADIAPGGGEYQNFGILQAMDHLAVLADIVAHGPEFDRSQIIAFGSSHGGYIAHLIAKLAPSSLSMVMDNSAYTQPPTPYLGFSSQGECRYRMNGVNLVCKVASGWTLNHRDDANFYSRDADLIRDIAHRPHIETMRAATSGDGPVFAMVNAATDPISPPEKKRRQAALLLAAGLDSDLSVIERTQIDGRVFKSFTHGLDASLKNLFDRFLPRAAPRRGPLDCESEAVIDYRCVDRGYRFSHGAQGVRGELYELHALPDA